MTAQTQVSTMSPETPQKLKHDPGSCGSRTVNKLNRANALENMFNDREGARKPNATDVKQMHSNMSPRSMGRKERATKESLYSRAIQSSAKKNLFADGCFEEKQQLESHAFAAESFSAATRPNDVKTIFPHF